MIELIDLRDEIPGDIIPLLTADAYRIMTSGSGAGVGIYEDDKPAGAVVANNEDGAGVIRHIYVEPDYRRRGFGTELVYRLGLVLSALEDVYRIEASFADESDTGLGAFFASLDFTIEDDPETGEFVTTLKEAAGSEALKKAKYTGVTPYAEVDKLTRNDIVNKEPVVKDYLSHGPVAEKMSCVMYDDNDPVPESMLLFGEQDDELIMIWAESGDRNMALLSMIGYALHEGLEEFGPDKVVRLPYINEVSRKIIEKIMGGNLRQPYVVKKAVYSLEEEDEME